MKKAIAGILLTLTASGAQAALPVTVTSPDGNIEVVINNSSDGPHYTVKLDNQTFLEPSSLGLKTSLGNFSNNLTYVSHKDTQQDKHYELMHGKVSNVHYQANGAVITFTGKDDIQLEVEYRVSNRDVAFRYRLSGPETLTRVKVLGEATTFNLPDEATTFITPQALPETGWMKTKPSYEEPYTFDAPVTDSSTNGVGYTFPALFKNAQRGWLLISETGVDSTYVGSRLGESNDKGVFPLAFPQEGENSGIGSTYAAMSMPAVTPWRTITLGSTLAPIVETTVSYDLVEPRYAASQDYEMGRATWSWIVWQDDSINYQDQIKYIDLAAKLNFEYVLIDNWWDQRIGRDKIEKLVDYASDKGVGIILWYNSNGWWNDAPQTPQHKMNTSPARREEMAWLKAIGVKGLKVDFFGGDKQQTIQLYEDIFTDANDFGLTITVHGSTLPRGWERMYPNFVTSEAVLASENLVFEQDALDKHAFNATILPFTRNTVASMDFAPVFLNDRLSKEQKSGTIRKTTDTFELATGVLYFSPIQHFGLTPNNYHEQPDYVLELLKKMPTVWDETKFIAGAPGDYTVLARHKDDNWYIAAVNGEDKKKSIDVNLPMLSGKTVTMYYDTPKGNTKLKKVTISKDGNFSMTLQPQGGIVITSG
ncbi:glycoside hydrolase family 97 protein [Salinimonas iocasae]|uniref:Glycoside hydrolase family 97 protein n=1 Tax=Salinimonas iocasae TaxID=2572577 RepID=A0A5B7YEQ6_9ALTE|nr:glycoside hydrolase family 97 protein [Salinimonas iocasae]QCZ94055.1 glycoside hydrolase family 97 protein [Salinimonas iocasae]